MQIRPGDRLLQYRVVDKIGSGGMGEVYRAEDTRLGREVAIKVLPEKLRRDPERLARLEREARALATLNHPQVATLHGLEEDEAGTRFLVMELVEGETLARRLERGALPVAEVCSLGAEIAGALAAAHERGIVHRDLKPGNVMLTRSGVKLLDFGLAKATAPDLSGPETQARTMAANPERLTGEGTLVGTFQYMAPEQLEGHEADVRADVWALGAVLHEMATGRPPFEGKSAASLIAAVLERDPARLSDACELAPAALDHLVGTCLVKDPERRRRSAADLALDLRWLASRDPDRTGKTTEDRPSARRWQWAAGLAVLVSAAALTWTLTHDPGGATGAPRTRASFELTMPSLDWNATESGIAISPSGDALAYMSEPAPGLAPVLWLRQIDDSEPRRIAGTEGAMNPFWAPDGRRLGYVKDGAIWVVGREGGPPQLVTRTLLGGTTFGPPSWSPDGTILYTTGLAGGARVRRVPASGGEPAEIRQPVEGIGQIFPSALPDGRRFLYLVGQESVEIPATLYVASLEGADHVPIEGVHSRAEYGGGYLFYWAQGSLVARPFDLDSATFTGNPLPIGEMPGGSYARTGMAEFSVARNGTTIAYGSAVRNDELRWFGADGTDLGRLAEPGAYDNFRISPVADLVALEIEDPSTGSTDLAIFDLQRGVPARTFGGPGSQGNPVWSPDGARIAYASDALGPPQTWIRRVDGSDEPRLVPSDLTEPQYVQDWSPGDEGLVVMAETQAWDIHVVPLERDGGAESVVTGPGNQGEARISPDGRWLAFVSDESGRREVYVVPLTRDGVPERISSGGGRELAWHPQGTELYYAEDTTLYAVPFSPATGEPGLPRVLFSLEANRTIMEFDVSRDGERFLVGITDRTESTATITLLLNWLPLPGAGRR